MDNVNIAQTISQQIGGRALKMIGARDLVAIESGLQFKLGRGARNANGAVTHVRIVLDQGADLYDVEFLFVRGVKVTTRAKTEGAYADMLNELIESETGMYTSL